MLRRLTKELHPLLMPWAVAVAGSMAPPGDEVTSALATLATFGGFAVVAATAFGAEYHQRTFALWLSQPATRDQLWRDKFTAVALAGALLLALNWRVQQALPPATTAVPMIVGMCLFAAVCSIPWWLRMTHHTLLAVFLSFAIQTVVIAGVGLGLAKVFGPMGSIAWDTLPFSMIFEAGLVYASGWLWLSRRDWTPGTLKAVAATAGFLVLCGISNLIAQNHERRTSQAENGFAALFLAATLCSAAFWTLLARSTLSGAVLTLAAQLLGAMGLGLALSQSQSLDVGAFYLQTPQIIFVAGIVYCAGMLWLGWHKFRRLELRGTSQEPGAFVPGILGRLTARSSILRCRSTEATFNLARKELRLQRPLLLLAAVFCLLWLAVLGMLRVQPHEGFAELLNLILVIYLPACMTLAGCLSLGEEKTLGLTAWHLTLPISARRQWLVKLALGWLTALGLGGVLPWVLVWLCSSWAPREVMEFTREGWWPAVLGCGLFFVMGFWASTVFSTTVRSALAAVIAVVGSVGCAYVGNWCARQLGGLETGIFEVFALPLLWLRACLSSGDLVMPGMMYAAGVIILVILAESLFLFRRPQPRKHTALTAILSLVAVVTLLSFWVTDLALSVRPI